MAEGRLQTSVISIQHELSVSSGETPRTQQRLTSGAVSRTLERRSEEEEVHRPTCSENESEGAHWMQIYSMASKSFLFFKGRGVGRGYKNCKSSSTSKNKNRVLSL